MIFAAAPSQNEFLSEFVKMDLEWNRIIAFHMDEYIGLNENADQLFSRYLTDHLFQKSISKSQSFAIKCNQLS